MKIKLTRTKLAGAHEWVLEIQRALTVRDELRMAAESEHRYRMALEAIARSPESAREIAEEGLA